MHKKILLLLLLSVTVAASAAAAYKWVDEKGVTHFSEIPPAGQKSQEIQLPTTPAAGADSGKPAAKSWQEKETEFRRRQLELRESEEKAAREASDRRDRCLRARRDLDRLEASSAVYSVNEKGERIYWDDQARAARIHALKKEVVSSCDVR